MTLEDLGPDLRRVGGDLNEALRELVNRNLPLAMKPVGPDDPLYLALDIPLLATVLRTLPDAAGTPAFVEATVKAHQARDSRRGRRDSGGAGA